MTDVDALVSKLEEALAAHGAVPAKGWLRDGIVKEVKAKLANGTPLQESLVTNAVHELLATAEDKKAFTAKLEQLKQKNVPALGPFLQFLQQAHSTPPVRHFLAAMVPADERRGAASSDPSTSGAATPNPSLTAVRTPAADPAATTRGRTSRTSSFNAAAAGTTTGAAASKPTDPMLSPAPRAPASAANAYYQNNPMFGQDMTSPLPRTREYTPTLQADMPGRSKLVRPVLPDIGDLLQPGPSLETPQQPPQYLDQVPEWNSRRRYLTGLQILQDGPSGRGEAPPPQQLEGLPQNVQEAIVVNDLLYCFMGLEGAYIKAQVISTESRTQVAFYALPFLHPCLLELVERMLPICEYMVVLKRFIETRSSYSYGMVSQALAAAMRDVMEDWMLMAVQMEHQLRLGHLSLQSMLYFCQQPQLSLHLLATLAATAASRPKLTSAGVLDLLHDKWASLVGDPPARALVHRLLQAAAVPYFTALEAWLFRGVLDDPYGEFMVQEDKSIDKTHWTSDSQLAYWYQRYTVRQRPSVAGFPGGPDVPVMLRKVADVVLTTGKYLNAIRECGQEVEPPVETGTHLQWDAAQGYVVLIERAHTHASATLLDFLRKEHHLQDWLASLKHYFLLDQGDLMVHLLESAKEELSKPASEVLRTRVQSLLELAVRTSSVAADPYADNVFLDMNPRPLHELVRDAFPALYLRSSGSKTDVSGVRRQRYLGWQLLMLSYRVAWPLTLVVAQQQLLQYQIVFKHLFLFKFAERELASTWHLLQCTRTLPRDGRQALREAYGVCWRMMFLVQECLRYATTDILEPSWATLQAALRKATNIDQVIDTHTEFLQRALDGMLLTHKGVVRLYPALQQCALDFCALIRQHLAPVSDLSLDTSVDGLPPNKSAAQRDGMRRQRQAALQTVALDKAFMARVLTLRDEFAAKSQELLAAFASHVDALLTSSDQDTGAGPSSAMRSSLGAGGASSTKQPVDIREETEGLKNLIDRLSI